MYFLYTIMLGCFFLFLLPALAWTYFFTPKYRHTLRERFGTLPCSGLANAKTPCIWIHAVSVGEAMAAKGLVEALRRRYPKHRLLMSTVTKTGREVAHQQLPHVNLFYLPLDFPWIVNKVVALLRPRMLVVMETELWPNLYHACQRNQVPILVVNGRLSPRSAKRYGLVAFMMRRFLQPVSQFGMQSEEDALRLVKLGVYPHRITVTGNLKYDQAMNLPAEPLTHEMRERLAVGEDPLWLAASTHNKEEEIVLKSYLQLRQTHGRLRLILAPRHPERTRQVADLIRSMNLEPVLFSDLHQTWQSHEILLVDQVGWLFRLYSLAKVVFVGGSLIPHGGQNMLEPSAWGIPPVFGPHTVNFRQVVERLLQANAAIQVADGQELTKAIHTLLDDEERRSAMGRHAQWVVEENVGALERTLELFDNY
ncbi:MAG: 3-deoxy-D-manno-octulosonic acid transferase [Magnetococcales bacterium]|nr:3-deoxy-D-manno-octulosonic acid transferase [Magnetococcales bacterium]NGZ28258.1 3-deoxy-D-manno-octulosonic acid transferase [Magnetococcales bacterium]